MKIRIAERGLFELYREDPKLADKLVFGRTACADRRGFMKHAGLATMSALVGAAIPFHRNIPEHFIPIALASESLIPGKEGLTVFNDLPLTAETPAHLLDDEITPTHRHFVRNNGVPPRSNDVENWELTVDGEVDRPLSLSIGDLAREFEVVTKALTIECAGNGRAFFNPPAPGDQWTYGAVACSEWTGVRLADVLKATGIKASAVYTAHIGADTHVSGEEGTLPISRGVPREKAMNEHNLIAFAQNGHPIHPMNGAPLRLIYPGWPGSCSHKWLTRIWIRNRVHDGAKMTGMSYRIPNRRIAPGEEIGEDSFKIIGSMPVKSLITWPATGLVLGAGVLNVRGHAWAGDLTVASVRVSVDFGATWVEAQLDNPINPYAWQNWRAEVTLPDAGYYEIWSQAKDENGISQPQEISWNPKGYLNNTLHRVAVRIG